MRAHPPCTRGGRLQAKSCRTTLVANSLLAGSGVRDVARDHRERATGIELAFSAWKKRIRTHFRDPHRFTQRQLSAEFDVPPVPARARWVLHEICLRGRKWSAEGRTSGKSITLSLTTLHRVDDDVPVTGVPTTAVRSTPLQTRKRQGIVERSDCGAPRKDHVRAARHAITVSGERHGARCSILELVDRRGGRSTTWCNNSHVDDGGSCG
jgi:hypothetical protein